MKHPFRLTLASLALAFASLLAPFAVQAQSLTNFAENKLVDAVMRGQALGAPATFYVALFTAASDCEAGTVTEVLTSGTGYERTAVASSLANWAGTQSAGSTTASSGTGGQTSNNSAITIGTATTTSWGTVTHFGLYSASTAGDLWICQALTTPKTINMGDALPAFNAGSLTVTFQ
jgi:hypothetical protein